jgi:hypothetical protein
MNRYFTIFIPSPVFSDIEGVHASISQYSNSGDADNWEEGLFDEIDTLKTTPHHQVIERETRLSKTNVRRILYHQKGTRREYHIFFTVKDVPTPNPEPNTPYLAGHVFLLFVRHAAQKPLTTKELKERLGKADAEIMEIDALRAELENQ